MVEEPLTLLWQASGGPVQRLASTMRTPGEDHELAAGLLFSEGLLRHRGEIKVLSFCASGGVNELNRLTAMLRLTREEAERRLAHRPSAALPQSACGMCAFDELSNPRTLLKWAASGRPAGVVPLRPDRALLDQALEQLSASAPVFATTGASHTVVLLDPRGNLLAAAEDVGRHNACDKALGTLLLEEKPGSRAFRLPPGTGLVFSSRLSFELAAKAARVGAAWMASVGAPTSLAIELAQTCAIPTLGFLSHERYNVYVD